MGGWIARMLGRGGPSKAEQELALQVLRSLRKLVGDAATLEQARQRIIWGAKKGDLDDVVGLLAQSDAKVRDFIKKGR